MLVFSIWHESCLLKTCKRWWCSPLAIAHGGRLIFPNCEESKNGKMYALRLRRNEKWKMEFVEADKIIMGWLRYYRDGDKDTDTRAIDPYADEVDEIERLELMILADHPELADFEYHIYDCCMAFVTYAREEAIEKICEKF